MRLSIIIPVYNVSSYLDRCIEKLLPEMHNDDELWLIDDASQDNSGTLCDRWSEKDHRVKVVHRPYNGGLSAARNEGLSRASGRYITFVDSDDYLEPGTLSANIDLLERTPQADVVEYPVRVHHGAKNTYLYVPAAGEPLVYAQWVEQRGYLHSYAWNKMYRASLWEGHTFPEGRYYEDMFIVPHVLQKARSIIRSQTGIYYYCAHEGSISQTITPERIADLLHANIDLYHSLRRQQLLTPCHEDEMYLRICNHQIVYLQLGGMILLPPRTFRCRHILSMPTFTLKCKALMLCLLRHRYCKVMAHLRNLLML